MKARNASLATLVVTALAALASLLVPVPHGNNLVDFYADFSLSVAAVVLYAGGSVVILLGFGAFTARFRRAYTIIFSAMTLWGLAYLQLPLIVILNKINDSLFIAFTAIPFVLAAVLAFFGTRRLARLFNIKSLAMNWWFVLSLLVGLSALVVVVPHGYTPSPEGDYDASNVLIVLASGLFAFGAYNVLLVKRQASATFTNALAWLFLSMFLPPIVGGAGSTIVALISSSPAANQVGLLLAIGSSFVASAMFLRSAYSFNRIVESSDTQGLSVARSFFGRALKPKAETGATSVDIVVYAANLASNPRAIEAPLERLRTVTAQIQGGQKPGAEEDKQLLEAYLQIERYLLESEPVRKFTLETIRHDVAQKLRLTDASGQQTFWGQLPPVPAAS